MFYIKAGERNRMQYVTIMFSFILVLFSTPLWALALTYAIVAVGIFSRGFYEFEYSEQPGPERR